MIIINGGDLFPTYYSVQIQLVFADDDFGISRNRNLFNEGIKMILLEYRDKDTNDINCICSLSSFVEENNYDDLEKDIAKIKNSKVGDIVIEDHANIVRRIK